jgi:hypothetical protein
LSAARNRGNARNAEDVLEAGISIGVDIDRRADHGAAGLDKLSTARDRGTARQAKHVLESSGVDPCRDVGAAGADDFITAAEERRATRRAADLNGLATANDRGTARHTVDVLQADIAASGVVIDCRTNRSPTGLDSFVTADDRGIARQAEDLLQASRRWSRH